MFRRVVVFDGELRIRNLFCQIKQAEAEPGPQGVIQGHVNLLFRDQALLHGAHQCIVISAAAKVATRFHRRSCSFFRCIHEMMLLPTPDIVDCVAIGNHITLKPPLLAQQIVKQEGTGASGHTVDRVVSAHDAGDFSLTHHALELRQIRFIQIAFRSLGIETMPVPFRPAMHRVMLRAGHRQHVVGIITLNALDELDADLAREIRVFPVSLLTTSPARVAEDVDVRCPERQAIPPFGIAIMFGDVVVELRATFNADDRSFLMKQSRIPRRSCANRFREDSGDAIVGHAMQGFVPVIISRQTQTRNRRSGILQLRNSFRERHAADQIICTRFQRVRRVAPDRQFLDVRHAHGGS